MTEPVLATTKKAQGFGQNVRKYSWPPQPPHEFSVTSVTTAIKHGLPTPHLIGWAAKMTAEAAVRDHDIVQLMLDRGDKKGALSHLKGSRYRDMGAKADRGNIVHDAVDAYLSGKPWTPEQLKERMEEHQVSEALWRSTIGMVSGVMEFLWDSEIDIIANEATVYSRTHKYAGTLDILGKLGVGKTPRMPAVIDIKTSKAIYDEVALQLCAYARADFIGGNDGSETPLLPDGEPIQHGIVIRPKADGTYERADFTLTDDVFNMFLACLGVCDGVENNVLRKARRPSVQ